ncbi:hypothetical protein ACIGN6_36015 [Streptomyces sp. NPDC053792]|uniref:hypothetical protein n=1 Tax=Streptomyces sp. NPDC053792 TaxID=3365716 RepID=UPI0037D96DE0
MLEHWYFFASLGLPPQTAAIQLDHLTALAEEPGTARSEELVSSSIESLARAGTATMLYALPHVLTAQRRFTGATEVNARAAAFHRDIASVAPEELRARLGAALRAAGGPDTAKALAALEDLLRDIGEGTAAADPSTPPYHDLVEQLAPTATLVVARFLAARDPRAAGELMDDHPSLVEDALNGRYGRLALLQAAETSAVLRRDTTDRIRTALAVASRGAFDMEPDLLATAARVSFPLLREGAPAETGHAPDASATLDALEREALAGETLLAWLEEWRRTGVLPAGAESDARRAAYGHLGGVGNLASSAMPSVLWESALWSLAAAYDPGETTRRLARYWRGPDPRWRAADPEWRPGTPGRLPVTLPHTTYGHVVIHAHRLLTLRHPVGQYPRTTLVDGPVEETDPRVAAWLWSPWIHHHTLPHQARAGKPAAGAAPAPTPHLRNDQPEQLVRLLAAALLAAHLLTHAEGDSHGHGHGDIDNSGHVDGDGFVDGGCDGSGDGEGRSDEGTGERDHLLLLIVHVRDTLYRSFAALMEAVHGEPRKAVLYAGPLTALLLHAGGAADWIGKGARAAVHPAEIVRVVSALPGGTPHSALSAGGARSVALFWVQESLSRGAGPHRTEAGGRWFSGDTPPADSLIALVRAGESHPYSYASVRAAQLHRDLHAHSRHEALRWDWTPDGPRSPGASTGPKLTPGILTLSGPGDPGRDSFSVEEWHEMADGVSKLLKAGDTYAIVPVTVRTLRLGALLGRPELGDQGSYGEWVTDWTGLVTSLNTPTHLPRYVRARMFDMFRAQVEGAGSQERLRTVLEHVVDVIVDLSGGAQFFYERLFEELTTRALPPEMANRLRVRLLRALYHRWGGKPPVVAHDSPWSTYLGRVSGRGTEAALVRFLRATAAEQLQGQGTPLVRVMDALWMRTQRPLDRPAVREPAGRVAADPRFVVAVTQDRRSGEAVVYARNENSGVGEFHSTRPYVRDLFRPEPGAALPVPYPESGSHALGIVCSVPRPRERQYLWVNCGLDRPVACAVEPHELRRRRVGETVAVRFTAPDGEEKERPTVIPLAPLPPQDGDVRDAQLRRSDRFPWLRLKVPGVPTDAYPRAFTEQGVAARRRWDPDLARAFRDEASAAPVNTLARWHERLAQWVPLDAGLPELAVAAGTTGTPGATGAGATAGPTDHRVTGADTTAGPTGPGATGTDAAGSSLSEPTPVRLVLSGPATERSGFGAAWRFVTTPGNCYVLGPAAWHPEDWQRLDEACLAAPAGLVVRAEFRPGDSRLALAERDPFDRSNVRWLGVFDHAGGAREPGEDEEHGEDEGRVRDRQAHEEAFLRTDPAGRPEWQIDVPAVEGFPRTVRATFAGPAPQGVRSVLCGVESWGDAGARQAEVTVQAFREDGIQEEKPSPEQYARYACMPTREVVELARTTRNASSAFNTAFTRDGLRGLIATESLTLTGEFFGLTPASPRWAVVLNDYVVAPKETQRRPAPAPLPAERLVDHRVPACDPALLDRAGLTGIVVAQIKEAGQVGLVRVWFDLGSYVAVSVLPVACLDVEAPQTGDHITGVRGPEGWVFEVRRRMLHLEALWEWAPRAGNGWKRIGQGRGEDGGPLDVFQDPRGPRLAAEPASGEPEAGGRVNARRGSNKRNGDSILVVVQRESGHLVGYAAGIELGSEFRPAHLEQTLVDVSDLGEDLARELGRPEGTRFVRARREFELSPVGSTRRASAAPARQVHDPVAEWLRLIREPGLTLTGQLGGEERMLLPGCSAPDDDGVHRPWLALVDEPRAWVAGRNYSPDRVRAVPVEHGSGYRASFLGSPPLSVADFMAEIAPYATADGRLCDFRDRRHTKGRPQYVGVEESASGAVAGRFEFGFGWFVDIPVEALLVGGEPLDPDGLALFHGDQIDAMAFTADEAVPGGIAVSVDLADIAKGVERQIHREATRANVVHLLDVTVDRDRRRVTVNRAVTRSRDLGRTREDDHTEARPVSAVLETRDAEALLAALDEGTERRLMLGRLVPETVVRRRRALRFATVMPSPSTRDGDAGLRRDDQLYLEAGTILETVNDHLLRFALPRELRQEGEPLAVVVPRRDFSHRESCLRRAAKTEGLGAYQGRARMLVRLGNHHGGGHTNQWHGITKSPPARGIETLRSYLRLRPEGAFGVVDEDALRIELRPGVVFDIAGMTGVEGIAPGSVVRLALDGAGGADEVRVHQAIPADITYLDHRPRPVVVFPKDGLKRAEDIRKADYQGRFTVAGLPGLNATAEPKSGAGLLRTPHPKITGVIREVRPNGSMRPMLVTAKDLRAGTLAFDPADAASGVRVVPVGASTKGSAGSGGAAEGGRASGGAAEGGRASGAAAEGVTAPGSAATVGPASGGAAEDVAASGRVAEDAAAPGAPAGGDAARGDSAVGDSAHGETVGDAPGHADTTAGAPGHAGAAGDAPGHADATAGAPGRAGAVVGRAVPWAQLSFLDAPARQLAAACQNWGWRYHDSRTRTWPEDGGEPDRVDLATVAHSTDEPVFFSARRGRWTLRHEPSALRQFGFPATELLEETFQDLPGGRRTHWAVARAHAGSVWLELTPGRVAEVRGELVRFTDGHSLAGLDWSRFAPGDLLYGHVEGGVNECGHLVLEDWRPGLRGSLAFKDRRPQVAPSSRVLLPVAHADEEGGALYLGEGEATLPYPAERELIARHPAGGAVWLSDGNELTAAAGSPVAPGDVVLLAPAPGGGLRIAGLPGALVELAPLSKECWLRTEWLRRDLAASAGAGSAVLRALGALPVSVETVTEAADGSAPVVTVSRRRQRGGIWPDGTVLARPVAELGGGHLVMRTGAALVRAHVNELLPGLPAEAVAATATALVGDRRLLRLHWDNDAQTLTSGLATDRSEQGETVVRALLAVNAPDGTCLGVLCRDERSQALCWLPARDAAWAAGVPGELLATHLRASRRLTVLRRGRCVVSLVHHPLIAREYENLAAGQLARVTVVGAAAAPGRRALHVSVGSLGVLALYTPGRGAPEPGEQVMAEVARLDEVAGRGTVQFVEPGTRRTVVDLPDWLCRGLGKLSLPTFAAAAEHVADLVPGEFATYRAAYQAGLEGAEPPAGSSAKQKVLWALGALEQPSGEHPVEARRVAAAAVGDWLRSPLGRTVVLQEDEPVDLAPVLAVCRIGALLPQQASGLPRGWVTFLLARVGERAVSSLHTEALVSEWLTRPERHVQAGDWRRLRSVPFARHLSFGQVASVEDFARAVTGRPTMLQHGESAKVARALLASIGRLPSAEHLDVDAPLMTRLARLGQSLTPPHGQAVPEWQPLVAQFREVHTMFPQVMRLPLTLMPAYVPLSAEGARYGAALLREAEAASASTSAP